MLTMTVSQMDRGTLAVLAPSVTKALDIDETEFGLLASAFSMAYLFATPLGGWWIDRIGARRGLLVSVLTWSVVAGLHALVPGFGVLFAMRIALGLTEGPSFPGTAQTMQRVLHPVDRPRGYGLVFVGSSFGGLFAPPLASLLFGHVGWRLTFLGTAAIGLLWVPLWLAITSPPRVATLLDAPVVPSVPAGARPSLATLARHPLMLRAWLSIFAVAPAGNVFATYGAKYLARRFQTKQEDVGHYLWLGAICLDVGAILFGDLLARTRRGHAGPPRLLYAIAAMITCGIGLLPLAETPWQGVAIIGLGIGGAGGVYTLTTADLLGRMPPSIVSTAGGAIAGAQSLAMILTLPLVGRAVDHFQRYDEVAVALAVWVIPGALAWLLWPPAATFEDR